MLETNALAHGGMKFASPVALPFGAEFSVVARSPTLTEKPCASILRRYSAVGATAQITVEAGDLSAVNYVVVKTEARVAGYVYEALPRAVADQLARDKEREVVARLMTRVPTTLQCKAAPVRVVDGRISIEPTRMVTDRAYRVTYHRGERVVVRNSAGEIEVYCPRR